MPNDYPNDADGDALRRVAEHGADMSQPMMIEFTIGVPTVAAAQSLVEVIAVRGYAPRISVDEETGSISIYCARTMLATYEGLIDAQSELNQLCEPFGAECDGWMTSGDRTDH